ncbi:hypothetical protein [Peristeroidobacter soli]|jgi:hypothetical protein|uniref:hypothetical protein n=1 Tax=Peristeroidobacter soli TaxID=2497877 RepID=UPI00101BD00C|nr:hypothetical protein [Peristeroidobacter soli]
MRLIKFATLLLACSVPSLSFGAGQWSGCQTVTGVTNYLGFNTTNPSISVALSPGIPGCVSDAPGGVSFALQQLAPGSTVDALKTFLAQLLTAQASGTRVMVFYDPATSCSAQIVSVGGYSGQCF